MAFNFVMIKLNVLLVLRTAGDLQQLACPCYTAETPSEGGTNGYEAPLHPGRDHDGRDPGCDHGGRIRRRAAQPEPAARRAIRASRAGGRADAGLAAGPSGEI